MKKARKLPNGWIEFRIKDKFQTGSGATPLSTKKEFYENGNIPWINSGELESPYINSTSNFITQLGFESSNTHLFAKNTVLLAMYGATAGKASLLEIEACTNQAICAIKPNDDFSSLFIKYQLDNLYDYLVSLSSGSARNNLSQEGIGNLTLFAPKTKDEQEHLIRILRYIDSKIENNNKINAELESLAKTIYDYWFLQFEFPNEEGKPYKSSGGKMVWNEKLNRMIPDGWKDGNLYDIAEFTNGLACQKHRPIKNNQRLLVIKIREMHNGFTSETEWVRDDIPQKYVIEDGDILFSWSATLETIIWTGGQGALNQHIFKVSEKNCAKYYVFMQLAEYVKNFVAMAEARKTTMGHITSDHLNQSRIVLPCTQVIDSFEKKVTPLFTSIIKNKQESIELSKLRDFLLPMLLNGQVGFIENE